jgi:hypothetical protein
LHQTRLEVYVHLQQFKNLKAAIAAGFMSWKSAALPVAE